MAKTVSDVVFALLLGVLLLRPSDSSSAFELSFDDPTAGFFLRDKANPAVSAGNQENVLAASAEESEAKGRRNEKILQASRFTSVRRSSPLSLRASYGPFRVSQTVPAAESFFDVGIQADDKTKTADKDVHSRQLELSAHLVTTEVPKDRPMLRVLFHVGRQHGFRPSPSGPSSASPSASSDGPATASRLCVVVHADLLSAGGESRAGMRRSARCSPSATEATCLAEIQLPSAWWPSLTPLAATATAGADAITSEATFGATKTKQPKVSVRVTYAAFEDHTRSCEKRFGGAPMPASVETTRLATVALTPPSHGYTQLGHDDIVHMLMPQAPKFPNSKLFVPVFLENTNKDKQQIEAITITCRTKPGVRVLAVEENPLLSSSWNIVSEINARGSVATVKATKKAGRTESAEGTKNLEGPQELYSWLLHVDEKDLDDWTKTRLTWHVSYRTSANETGHLPETGVDQFKIRSKLTVQKDEVQAVLPIVKDSELLNVAVLTGRQVSRPLKVLIVSESGEIADVTLHSSCSSTDESAFKVTASCTSFYLDGSETRGALSAAIAVQYGSRSGSAVVTVWMPETPLRIEMDDSRLSQIDGWKTARAKSRVYAQRREAAASPISDVSEIDDKKAKDASICGPRYQQSKVRVLARFLAEDPDTGRKDFFPSRGVELDVTDLLVGHAFRLEDSAVAAVTADVIEGLSLGKTDLQVISPITGQVLGRHEVQVVKSRESVSGMNVRLLTGLQLAMSAHPQDDRRLFSAKATYTSELNKKYQEGLLDVELLFSDDTTVRLGDISPDDFRLAVHSLDPKVIAFAPTDGARHPRVIAVGSGHGPLLEVVLRPAPDCEDGELDAEAILAEATVEVAVRIEDGKEKEPPEDKSPGGRRGLSVLSSGTQAINMGDLGDALTNVALRDDYRYQPAVSSGTRSGAQQQQVQQQLLNRQHAHAHVTPLEIGMYALLAVFCAAITVFIGSCFVYASRFQRQQCISVPATIQPIKSQSVQNAHGWVWLGRSTMDKTSMSTQSGGTFAWRDANTLVMCEAAVPVTSPANASRLVAQRQDAVALSKRKSQRLSYVGSEINIIPNPHTDEYEAEVSTPSSPDEMTTAMVCQELPRRRTSGSGSNNNQPRPPNATPARRLRSVEEDRNQERAYLMAESSFAQDLGLPMTAAPARLPPEYRPPRRLPPSPTTTTQERQHPLTETRTGGGAGDTARSGASSSSSSSRPSINTATYTKKHQVAELDQPDSRPLALVFPDTASTAAKTTSTPPLRQSPASALPPYIAMDEGNSANLFLDLRPSYVDGVDDTEDGDDDASMLNPALDMPSPPSNGDRNFLGLSSPKSPEKTFDSSTFTKSNSPSSSSLHDEIDPEQDPAACPANEGDEAALAMGMDYEQLMTYFESLRESSA